jgi:hypothetical protein
MPLARLEKGDKAVIKVHAFHSSIVREKDLKKYKDVPDGEYEAICVDDYKLECKEYPVLNGRYNFWHGDKWGCTYGIYADEVK